MLLAAVTALAIVGCGFSVGNSKSNEDYESLFPDKAATEGSAYKHSFMTYTFSLEGMGEMNVSVDTSNGHKFELQAENGGFNIEDKDGNVVIYAACINPDSYKELTTYLDMIETYNGRDFISSYNGDGSTDMFSYMADCGLDCGLVMETKGGDPSVFSLVAFRGTPLEGSSSDVNAYKGQYEESEIDDEYFEDDLTAIEDEATTDETVSDSLVNSTVDGDIETLLANLDTDYNKINWGVRYSISEDIPGVVVSIAPCYEYEQYKLILAITNLTGTDIDFSAQAIALDANGEEEGSTFVYARAIGSLNTYVTTIPCGENMPTGVVHWEDGQIGATELYKYTPWLLDYGASGKPSDGVIEVQYEMYSANDDAIANADINFLLIDANGNILGTGFDFLTDEVPAGEKYSGSVSIYNDSNILSGAADVAIFANPYLVNY